MIFISTGTFPIPFKRLINTTINYYKDKPKHKVIIQSGTMHVKSSAKHIIIKSYFPFKQTLRLYQQAELNISAAGEATALLLLKHSKNMPIFFPRLKKYQEHVDNIQLQTCEFLRRKKLAKIAITTKQLQSKLSEKLIPNQAEKYFSKQHASFNHLITKLSQITENLKI